MLKSVLMIYWVYYIEKKSIFVCVNFLTCLISFQQPSFSFEEPPISIKSCLVDIAHDYSRKRKNVFRLTTYSDSVYLLQAEDKGTMMSWIQAIKINNNPDNDVSNFIIFF